MKIARANIIRNTNVSSAPYITTYQRRTLAASGLNLPARTKIVVAESGRMAGYPVLYVTRTVGGVVRTERLPYNTLNPNALKVVGDLVRTHREYTGTNPACRGRNGKMA